MALPMRQPAGPSLGSARGAPRLGVWRSEQGTLVPRGNRIQFPNRGSLKMHPRVNKNRRCDAWIGDHQSSLWDAGSARLLKRPRNLESPTRVAAMEQDAGAPAAYSLLPVLAAVSFAGLGAFLFGYHLGVVNGPLEAIAADLGFAGNAVLQGSVVSSLLGGAAVGSICGGSLADKFGRRLALVLDTTLLVGGTLLSAQSTTLQTMVIGRIVAGLGIGVSSACVPLYISEVAPTAIRGALGSVNQLAICLGILGALIANVVIPPTAWRSLFSLGAIPAVALAVGMLLSPESPRWLLSKGNTSAAGDAMRRLWGQEDTSLSSSKEGATKSGAGFGALFQRKYAGIVSIGCLLFLLQQWSGVNAIVYFSTKVFGEAGISSGTLASAAVGATNVFGTILATGVIDKMGRKQLLSWSFTGMGLAMIAMAAGLALESLKAFSGPLALGGTLFYILSFGLGVGPVPALIIPEMNATEIRGLAMSAAMGSHWVTNLALGQLFLPAVSVIGVPGVYTFFAAVCFLAVLFTNKWIPETKGKSLEEIQKGMSV